MGTTQLLSIPYALHAKTAETINGTITETDPVFTSWDKSTGISIKESQTSDFGTYIETETDPVFDASVVYDKMIAILVEAIKEQQKIIEELREEIDQMKDK